MKMIEQTIEKQGDKIYWDHQQHVSHTMGLKLKDKGAEKLKNTVESQLELDATSEQLEMQELHEAQMRF